MKKEVFLLVFIILVFSGLVSASQLKVTLEHPFLIDNKWVEAKQLTAGDMLATVDGKKARITSIEQVYENVSVYNIEDYIFHNYIADNIIVHNSNKPRPVFAGVPEISPQELDLWIKDKAVLDQLIADGEPGIARVDTGSFKQNYIINPSRISPGKLPERVLVELPEEGIVVFKNLRPVPRRPDLIPGVVANLEDVLNEVQAIHKVRTLAPKAGGKSFVARIKKFGVAVGENECGKPISRGLIIQEYVPEQGALAVQTKLEFAMKSTTNPARQARAIELGKALNRQIGQQEDALRRIFVQEGLVWEDTHPGNFAIGFRVNYINGYRIVSLEEILSNSLYKISDLEIYARVYELGFISFSGKGSGELAMFRIYVDIPSPR